MKLGGHIEIECKVGSVPELVNEMCGHKLVRFLIAVIDRRINNNRYTQQTYWYTVNALGDTAEMILKSGLRICENIIISGRWVIDGNRDMYGNDVREIIAESVSVAKDGCVSSYEVA